MRSCDLIFNIIAKNKEISPHTLASTLGISTQAVHRQLRLLLDEGRIERSGTPPKTVYSVNLTPTQPGRNRFREIGTVLGTHPAVRMVTLFGSQARGEATAESDIDVLVWLDPTQPFHRQDIWNYWDRQSRHLPWAGRVSLIVRKWHNKIEIDTLLLDFPEEHIKLFAEGTRFERMRAAVLRWREKNDAQPLRSFGATHGWSYTSDLTKKLADLDFTLEIENVP